MEVSLLGRLTVLLGGTESRLCGCAPVFAAGGWWWVMPAWSGGVSLIVWRPVGPGVSHRVPVRIDLPPVLNRGEGREFFGPAFRLSLSVGPLP